MAKYKNIPDNANAIRLNPWELLLTLAVVLIVTLLLLPWIFMRNSKVEIEKDFRLSYRMRDDYLGYRKIAATVCEKHSDIFIGDSVIWGMYVNNENTLPALLNKKMGKESFGNLAIDGLHPVAMETLVRYYGQAISGKRVFLYWNPLWMNTKLYDLTGEKEFSINHPRLLPQFDFSIKSFRPALKERCSAFLEQKLDFYAMLHHFRAGDFENADFKTFIAENPGENPFKRLNMVTSPIEEEHAVNSGNSWDASGIRKQDWEWVKPEESRQFKAFIRIAELLRERKNHVVVVLGSINPYMQTAESLARYREVFKGVESQVKENKFDYMVLPELPSKEYADASHPLASGYHRLADFIFKQLTTKGDI